MNRKHLLTSAVGALVATAIAGGVAYATIPAANGTINGCYRNSEDDQKGQLRVVDDPTACRSNELPIAWSQVGPQGANGEPGAPGTNGTDGTNGADGKDGSSVTTASEAAGANCADGGVQLTAVNGVGYVCNGERGPEGDGGPQGEPGTQGPQGAQGSPGPAGPPGADGNGLSSLADLDGLPCTLAPSAPGVVDVIVDSSANLGFGVVSLRCVPTVGTTLLHVEVKAHCIQGAFDPCTANDASIAVAGGGTCTAMATVASSATKSCSFSYPTGTVVQLTASTPRTPIWGGACTGVIGTICPVTLSGSEVDVSVDY